MPKMSDCTSPLGTICKDPACTLHFSRVAGMKERWNPGFDFDLTWYLSGPMSGYPEYNYPAFTDAARVLRNTGVKLESPHENQWPEEKLDEPNLWAYMMDLALAQMDCCGGIILLKGWPQSRGSKAELEIALQKDWPVWYYNDYSLTNMNKELS